MSLNVYKVSFSNNTSADITTPLTLTSDFIKSEFEKISKVEVVKVSEVTNVDTYNATITDRDVYFGVMYNHLGNERIFNRILIPNIKDVYLPDSEEKALALKVQTLAKNLYGINVELKALRKY